MSEFYQISCSSSFFNVTFFTLGLLPFYSASNKHTYILKINIGPEIRVQKDGNLDFNIDKTKILTKGPTTQHVFNLAKHFLDNDPDLQEIANDFTLDMFKDEGIEVLGAPVGTDRYIKTHVAQNCLRIMADITKHESLDDGLVHFHLLKYCMNTCTQYISANVTLPSPEHFLSLQHQHVDRTLANVILRKGTRGLCQHWSPHDIDLTTTMIQMTLTWGVTD